MVCNLEAHKWQWPSSATSGSEAAPSYKAFAHQTVGTVHFLAILSLAQQPSPLLLALTEYSPGVQLWSLGCPQSIQAATPVSHKPGQVDYTAKHVVLTKALHASRLFRRTQTSLQRHGVKISPKPGMTPTPPRPPRGDPFAPEMLTCAACGTAVVCSWNTHIDACLPEFKVMSLQAACMLYIRQPVCQHAASVLFHLESCLDSACLRSRVQVLGAAPLGRSSQSSQLEEPINQFTFSVFRTQQGSQHTAIVEILGMLTLNKTSHSMLFWGTIRRVSVQD